MIRTVNVVTPELIYGYGVVYYTRLDISERAALTVKHRLAQQLGHQQRLIQRMVFVSPALMLQEYLSALTGTHAQQFNRFVADVDSFKAAQQRYYVPKIMSRATYHAFTVPEVDQVPRFPERSYHDYAWIRVGWGALVYLALLTLMLFLGYRRMLTATR